MSVNLQNCGMSFLDGLLLLPIFGAPHRSKKRLASTGQNFQKSDIELGSTGPVFFYFSIFLIIPLFASSFEEFFPREKLLKT